jgi:hypothetical protein
VARGTLQGSSWHEPVRLARWSLLGVAGLIGFDTIVGSAKTPQPNPAANVENLLLAGIYFGLARWSRRRPLRAFSLGLGLYIITFALALLNRPWLLAEGIVAKIAILLILACGVVAAAPRETTRKRDAAGRYLRSTQIQRLWAPVGAGVRILLEVEAVACRSLMWLGPLISFILAWPMLTGAAPAAGLGYFVFALSPVIAWVGMRLSRNCVRRGELCRALFLRCPGLVGWALLVWFMKRAQQG